MPCNKKQVDQSSSEKSWLQPCDGPTAALWSTNIQASCCPVEYNYTSFLLQLLYEASAAVQETKDTEHHTRLIHVQQKTRMAITMLSSFVCH
eukprot:1061197-Amphidinium_carterae.1